MACGIPSDQCRARHIAPHLRDAEPDGADYEARCPVCGCTGFRISEAKKPSYRHVWTCAACKRRRDDPAALRAALLALGISPGCLGIYALDLKPAADPLAAAALREAVDMILNWPGLDPSRMRLILAEARGDKIPGDYRDFARFAQQIGIGRRHSYNLAAEFCRPADGPPPPGEGGVDNQS